ncbi:MAG: P-loop NTPase [Rhodobacteraceae bacterium]|nr:P-loop NTPase [Paracoccaceae bacterium]
MERIQSAIAKARAARQRQEPPPGGAAPEVARGPAAGNSPWLALTEVRLDPDRLEASRIVTDRPGPDADAYDMIRTRLVHQLRERGWTRVAITSPGSRCGKTTTCLNLALSLARQSDLRVVVLELDLRRPSMAALLGLSPPGDLAAVLAGERQAHAQMLRYRTNLALAMNARPVPNAAELLASARAAAAVDEIEEMLRPDVMLFDTSPALVGDNALSFLDQVDCALLIAAAEESTVAEIDRAGELLAGHTQVLGVVLNKCRFLDRSEGYGED